MGFANIRKTVARYAIMCAPLVLSCFLSACDYTDERM